MPAWFTNLLRDGFWMYGYEESKNWPCLCVTFSHFPPVRAATGRAICLAQEAITVEGSSDGHYHMRNDDKNPEQVIEEWQAQVIFFVRVPLVMTPRGGWELELQSPKRTACPWKWAIPIPTNTSRFLRAILVSGRVRDSLPARLLPAFWNGLSIMQVIASFAVKKQNRDVSRMPKLMLR